MPRKKTPKGCDFLHNQAGIITKVLIPVEMLQREYDSSLLQESPLYQVFQYIEEYNEQES